MANELNSAGTAAAESAPVYRRHDGNNAAKMASACTEQAAHSQQTEQVVPAHGSLRLLPHVQSALEQVAKGGGQAAVATLKHALEDNPHAAPAAALQVVEALQQATCHTVHVEACRMVRAMCLAGYVHQLETAGTHTVLLQMLTDPAPGSRALALPATEALLSCALRSSCVGTAVKALPGPQLKQLMQLLHPHSMASMGASHTDSKPDGPAAAPAAVRTLSDNLAPTAASDSAVVSSEGSNATNTALLHSMLRLMTSLVNNAAALPALLQAGLLQALLQLAVTAAEPSNVTRITGTADSATTSDRLDSVHNEGSSETGDAAAQAPQAQLEAQLAREGNAGLGVQTSALGFLLKFSQYLQLHAYLVAAGAGQQLIAVLKPSLPPTVLEPAVCILSNLAHGSPACQARLVSAGVIKPLVGLLAVKHAGVVCSTADALANLVLHNQAAQRQLGTARCTFPGMVQPNLLGKAQVAAAAAGTSSGSNIANNGIAGLVRLLHSGSAPLMVKVLRALANAVLGCAANQNLFLATGALPAVLVMCEVPATARQAVGLVTNLLPGCEAAHRAALAAGLPAVVVRLLSRTPAGAAATDTGTDTNHTPAAAAGSTAADSAVAADELMERSCLLAANLAAGGAAAKSALVDAGVLQQLLVIIREAAATSSSSSLGMHGQQSAGTAPPVDRAWIRVASAAAGAVSNFVLKAEDVAGQAVQQGAVTDLLQLVKAWQQVEGASEVVSRAVHALGSLMSQSSAAKAAALEADVHTTLIAFLQADDTPSNVALSCCRALTHLTLSSPSSQVAVAQKDGVQCLLRVLQQAEVSDDLLGAALSAVASLCQGCSTAQLQFLKATGANSGPQLLVARLDPARNTASTINLTCACVHALACPVLAFRDPHNKGTGAGMTSSLGVMGDVGSLMCGGDDARQEASRAAVHQVQEALADAGALTALVALLGVREPQLVDAAAMALSAMLSTNRSCQKMMAGAGGVGQLAALLDRVDAASRPALARHIVDAWLELGGATAVVKLLSHTQARVVELACRRITTSVQALAGQGAAAPHPEAVSCTWLVGAGWSLDTSPVSAAVASLVKAGAPAALLRTCRTHKQPRVIAAALLALRALLQVGDDRVRSALLQAGAEQCLQQLQQAASAAPAGEAAADAGLDALHRSSQAKPVISQQVMHGKQVPRAFSVGSPGGLQLSSSPLFVGGAKSMLPSKALGTAAAGRDMVTDRKARPGLPPTGKPGAQAGLGAGRSKGAGDAGATLGSDPKAQGLAARSPAAVRGRRSTSPPVTAQHVAALAEQICMQLMS